LKNFIIISDNNKVFQKLKLVGYIKEFICKEEMHKDKIFSEDELQ